MRKLLVIFVFAVFVILFFPQTMYATNDIRVIVDGELVVFSGQSPVIVDGRTLVPVRGVFETLGFDVGWNSSTRQAILVGDDAVGNDIIIVISIGSSYFTTNGQSRQLDVPAQIIGGSTMIPLRAVLESAGYYLDWDANTRTVIISSTPIDEWIQARRNTNESLFGMTRLYVSENFYWYSTEANAEWLPDMAVALEERLPVVLETFNYVLIHRIPIFYYCRYDMDENIRLHYTDLQDFIGHDGYAGFASVYVSVVRPAGSTVVTYNTVDWLVHETVHVIQRRMTGFDTAIPSWLLEGTAAYFEIDFYARYSFIENIKDMVVRNQIPTLAQMEDRNFFWESGRVLQNYAWGATIIQFIHSSFGFEYVVNLHRNYCIDEIFGISRAEFERLWHQFMTDNYSISIVDGDGICIIGTWIWIDNPTFVTTFNADGTGFHERDWGFGTEFEWRISNNVLRWMYPNHNTMTTGIRVFEDSLYFLFGDDYYYRYVRCPNQSAV